MKYSFVCTGLAGALALLTHPVLASERLEEVVVTASRNPTPLREVGATVSVITKTAIQLEAATTLNDLLRNQPGIASSNSGGLGKDSAIRIRGEEGYRTLILIDGVEMTDPTGTQAMSHVEHLNINSDIERIEILRGPQGFVYGADAGGVINIFTRTTSEGLEGRLAAEYGSYNTQKFSASVSGGNSTADGFVSASRLTSDGYNARTSDESDEDDGYENATVHAKGGVNITDKVRLQAVVRSTDATSEYDNCGSESEDCEAEFEQTVGRLSLAYNGDRTQQTLAYSSSDIDRTFITDGAESYAYSGALTKAEYLGTFEFNPAITAVWGADYRDDTLDATASDPESSRSQLGLFAELQSQLHQAFYFTVGLRHDDNDDFGRHNSYRVTGAWLPVQQADETLKLRASAGSGFRAPALSEQAYNRGPWASGDALNLTLDAETSEGVDVGLDYINQFNSEQSLSLGITLFAQTVENEIYFDLVNYAGYLQADGESTSKGVELTSEWTIHANVDLLFNTTWNPTEDRDGEPRVRRPENTSNLGVRLHFLDRKLRVLTNLYNARSAEDIDGSAMDDYNLLSVSANWQLGDLLITARIDNLTDEDYQQAAGYNTAERSFNAGVQYTF